MKAATLTVKRQNLLNATCIFYWAFYFPLKKGNQKRKKNCELTQRLDKFGLKTAKRFQSSAKPAKVASI